MTVPGRKYSDTVSQLSEAITRLYLANPTDSAARWLYERWSAFLDSTTYNTTPDTLLFPVLKTFSTALFAARALATNKPAGTQAEVELERLIIGDVNAGFQAVSQAVDEAIDGLGDVSKRVAMGVLPLVLVVVGVPLAGAVTWKLLTMKPRR